MHCAPPRCCPSHTAPSPAGRRAPPEKRQRSGRARGGLPLRYCERQQPRWAAMSLQFWRIVSRRVRSGAPGRRSVPRPCGRRGAAEACGRSRWGAL
eukprot:scaffold171749_cov30-Tisochrysis_lutea.AAC.3